MFSPPWHTTSWREITLEQWLSADISVTAQYVLPGPQEPAQNISEAYGHNRNKSTALESIQISLQGIQQFWKTLKKALSYQFLLESFSLRTEQPTAVLCCFVVAGVHLSHSHPADVQCPHTSITPKKEEREPKPEHMAENPAMTPLLMRCSCVSILNGAKHPRHWGPPAWHHHSGVTLTSALLIN